MLHEFLNENRVELTNRCTAKVTERASPVRTRTALADGIPLFIGQLIETLRTEAAVGARAEQAIAPAIGTSAGAHGSELFRNGYTVEQVVHDYGDLCQALTELAHEKNAPITVDEVHTFNQCLDNAIAEAVTEFSRLRDRDAAQVHLDTMNERLGSLAHELRNQLNTAVLAFRAIKSGSVAIGGATGTLLERSLQQLRDLIDGSLADVRLTAGLQLRRELIAIDELIAEVRIPVVIEAMARGLGFSSAIEPDLVIDADRQMISSAVANLLQNALKFTRPSGHIALTARAVAGRVVLQVEDECGGLPAGDVERLFQPFKQHGDDRTGLGLGLSISRRGVEANGGKLEVRDLPGTGCIFTIDLPRPASVT